MHGKAEKETKKSCDCCWKTTDLSHSLKIHILSHNEENKNSLQGVQEVFEAVKR